MKSIIELAAAFGARGVAAIGGMFLSIVIGRSLGPSGLGQFAIFLSLLGLFTILSSRGIGIIIIRETAKSLQKGRRSEAHRVFKHLLLRAFYTSLFFAIIGFVAIAIGVTSIQFSFSSIMFAISLPAFIVIAMCSSYLKGAGKSWIGALIEPGSTALLASFLILLLMRLGAPKNLETFVFIHTIAIILFCIIGLYIVSNSLLQPLFKHAVKRLSTLEAAQKSKGELPLTVVSLSAFVMQAGFFAVISPFLSEEELGLIRAAERIALVIIFPVSAIEPFISHRVVQAFHSDNASALQKLLAKAVFVGGVISFMPLLVIEAYPGPLLSLMGDEFTAAVPYLRMIAILNFMIVLLNPFSTALSMAGADKELMQISIIFLISSLILFVLSAILGGAMGFVICYMLVSSFRVIAITFVAHKFMTKGRILK